MKESRDHGLQRLVRWLDPRTAYLGAVLRAPPLLVGAVAACAAFLGAGAPGITLVRLGAPESIVAGGLPYGVATAGLLMVLIGAGFRIGLAGFGASTDVRRRAALGVFLCGPTASVLTAFGAWAGGMAVGAGPAGSLMWQALTSDPGTLAAPVLGGVILAVAVGIPPAAT